MTNPFGRLLRLFKAEPRRSASPKPDFVAAQDVAFLPAADFRFETCPICRERPTGHVSIYPATPGSRMRSRIVWWCDACGSGFVPDAKPLLADYYEAAYASERKKDRALEPDVYFAPEARTNSRAIARHLGRVDYQIAALKRLGGPYDRVLDYGSGPGYFLKLLDPREKFAVEPDLASKKFLDFIGARRVSLEEVDDASLDLILASHSIEHLCIEELDVVLATMAAKLRPGALLYIEVPQAALTAVELPYRHEPHTIFFSPRGLDRVITRSGLQVVERSYRSPDAAKTRRNPIWTPAEDDPFGAALLSGMTIVARRPAAKEL